jgi:cytochrome c oxidase assembly protein subunit 15
MEPPPNMKTDTPWLHRSAILVAFCALLAIAAGAVVTSLYRPIAANGAISINPAFEFWHHMVAGVVVVLMFALAIALRSQFAWIALAAGMVDAGLGFAGQAFASILHALLAQIFFGLIVALAVMTSESWRRGPDPIQDSWRPSLRSLSIALPAVVLFQTTLGASYRYHALGVIWHILNAMLVLLLVLIVAVFLIRQFPQHPTIRPAAIAAAVITSVQVMLGFTTFMMLILSPDESSLSVIITSVLHVATGSLTFAAVLALAILIRYNIDRSQPLTGR